MHSLRCGPYCLAGQAGQTPCLEQGRRQRSCPTSVSTWGRLLTAGVRPRETRLTVRVPSDTGRDRCSLSRVKRDVRSAHGGVSSSLDRVLGFGSRF